MLFRRGPRHNLQHVDVGTHLRIRHHKLQRRSQQLDVAVAEPAFVQRIELDTRPLVRTAGRLHLINHGLQHRLLRRRGIGIDQFRLGVDDHFEVR